MGCKTLTLLPFFLTLLSRQAPAFLTLLSRLFATVDHQVTIHTRRSESMYAYFMSNDPANLTRTSVYHSFLLRLWQEDPADPWRASLQNVQTGTVVRFTNLNALVVFLQEQAICTPPLPPAAVDESPP